jgi:hypothetical protein
LVRDDIAGGRQQPKVQWFDEQLFIVLRVLQSVAGGSETTMSELYVFARPGILVTVGPRQGAGSFDVAAALDAAYPAVLGFGTLGAVHAIVARVVHGYLTVARDIEEELGGLEDQVFNETQKDDNLRIYRLRRRIGRVDRVALARVGEFRTDPHPAERAGERGAPEHVHAATSHRPPTHERGQGQPWRRSLQLSHARTTRTGRAPRRAHLLTENVATGL